MLVAVLGTPWSRPFAGSWLFWEDVSEPLYRIDRMLAQLRLSGMLDGIHGMIVGELELADPSADEPSWAEYLETFAARVDFPVLAGCPSGHCSPNLTIPLGSVIDYDAAAGRLLLG